MAATTSFYTEKGCQLENAHTASARRLCSSVRHFQMLHRHGGLAADENLKELQSRVSDRWPLKSIDPSCASYSSTTYHSYHSFVPLVRFTRSIFSISSVDVSTPPPPLRHIGRRTSSRWGRGTSRPPTRQCRGSMIGARTSLRQTWRNEIMTSVSRWEVGAVNCMARKPSGCESLILPAASHHPTRSFGSQERALATGVSRLLALGCYVEQFTRWVASARRRDRTVQTASKDVSVCARLRRIATFLFIGALEAYLLTYLHSY